MQSFVMNDSSDAKFNTLNGTSVIDWSVGPCLCGDVVKSFALPHARVMMGPLLGFCDLKLGVTVTRSELGGAKLAGEASPFFEN